VATFCPIETLSIHSPFRFRFRTSIFNQLSFHLFSPKRWSQNRDVPRKIFVATFNFCNSLLSPCPRACSVDRLRSTWLNVVQLNGDVAFPISISAISKGMNANGRLIRRPCWSTHVRVIPISKILIVGGCSHEPSSW